MSLSTKVYQGFSSREPPRQAMTVSGLNPALDPETYMMRVDMGSPVMKSFLAEAKQHSASFVGLEKAKMLMQFVNNEFEYDINTLMSIMLEQNIAERKGVCKHYAAALLILLRAEGFDASHVSGEISIGDKMRPFSGHAWVSLRFEGREYLVDPTWGVFLDAAKVKVTRDTELGVRTVITNGLLRSKTRKELYTREKNSCIRDITPEILSEFPEARGLIETAQAAVLPAYGAFCEAEEAYLAFVMESGSADVIKSQQFATYIEEMGKFKAKSEEVLMATMETIRLMRLERLTPPQDAMRRSLEDS